MRVRSSDRRMRATPIPRGSRPSTAALTSLGARKASDIVILMWRLLQASRAAMPSIPRCWSLKFTHWHGHDQAARRDVVLAGR
jgi:hypothetical protein